MHETDRLRVACLSTAPWNPYLRLLYDAVGAAGVDVVWGGRLSLRWLWRSRRSVRVLHVHWPESLYRFGRGPALLRRPLSWAKLALLALRLAAARALGYRLVWTVHQVRPHETTSRRLDAAGARLVAAFARALIVHDGSTAERVRRELRPARDPVVIPHGSYRGVYPPGRSRDEVARALDVAPGAFVFLCFGELRRYKGIQALLEAFAATGRDDVALIVAGNPKDPATAAALRQAAAADPRIRVRLGFVADDEVAELFELADAVVVARADGGTSGSLILALSLGRPVVAADTGVYRELANGSEPGWTFAPDDARSLREALVRAAGDRDGAAARGRYALEVAERLDWGPIGRATARVFATV